MSSLAFVLAVTLLLIYLAAQRASVLKAPAVLPKALGAPKAGSNGQRPLLKAHKVRLARILSCRQHNS